MLIQVRYPANKDYTLAEDFNYSFFFTQIYFQTNNMFSAESIYDALFLILYNVMYTSLPVLFLSLSEKAYPEKKLMRYYHKKYYSINA